MTMLNQGNCTVDKESGGVIFHGSPELREIVKLQKQIKELREENKTLNDKLDSILELLKGGNQDG